MYKVVKNRLGMSVKGQEVFRYTICAGKRGLPGGPGPVGPPGYCQFCDALAQQANRGSSKKG